MDPLDQIERAARTAHRVTERLTPKSLAVELDGERRVIFRPVRGLVRISVTVEGEPEADLVVSLDRAIYSVIKR